MSEMHLHFKTENISNFANGQVLLGRHRSCVILSICRLLQSVLKIIQAENIYSTYILC